MNHLARQELYFGKQFGLDEILGGIEAVSADDVRRVAAGVRGRAGHERPRKSEGLAAKPAELTV